MSDMSPHSFILGRAFHCPRKPPFSWFAQVIAWAQAIAHVSCQGLDYLKDHNYVKVMLTDNSHIFSLVPLFFTVKKHSTLCYCHGQDIC